MARTISIGAQDFVDLREHGYFYIDKTGFIRDWWKGGDSVTLIMRPRRFGKTLNMRTVEAFFSMKYKDRGEDLFGDLEVWKDPEMRAEQGAWPVIFLSFAGVKQNNYSDTIKAIKTLIAQLMSQYPSLTGITRSDSDKKAESMSDVETAFALNRLSELMEDHYGKKAIIILDEYDTPLQEAFVGGY